MWMAIVRDVRHYYSRVSRIPANQVVPQGGMQQSLLILGGDGSHSKESDIHQKDALHEDIIVIVMKGFFF